MNGDLNRRYDFPIIVSSNDLKSLKEMLSSGFVEFQYDINTKDGARYTLGSLEEVLNYSNPEDRMIQRICIKCNKEKGKSFLFPNISISLQDMSLYGKSCVLEIRQLEESEMCLYVQRIDEFTKSIKAPYWWLYKTAFDVCVFIILYSLFAFLYLNAVSAMEAANEVYNFLILQSLSICCAIFTVFVIEKMIPKLCPSCCFVFGEQAKHKERLDKTRNIILISIVLALAVGILGSILAHFILKIL